MSIAVYIRIEKCTSPEAWYRDRIGQTLKTEGYEVRRHTSQGIPEDVWWCREGGAYNAINYVCASDARVVDHKITHDGIEFNPKVAEVAQEVWCDGTSVPYPEPYPEP